MELILADVNHDVLACEDKFWISCDCRNITCVRARRRLDRPHRANAAGFSRL